MGSGFFPLTITERAAFLSLKDIISALDTVIEWTWTLEHDQTDNAQSDGNYIAHLQIARDLLKECIEVPK